MGVRTIGVILIADDTSLRSVLRRAAGSIDQFNNQATRGTRTTTNQLVRQIAFWGAGASAAVILARGLRAVVSATSDFDVAMRNVNSITHQSEAKFASTSAAVLQLSTTLPQSATTLANGLYTIASSGFLGAKGLTVLDAAARAASAGLTTTDVAATGIAAVLNAYGLSASSAKDVSDTLFQTVNVGVVTFAQLSQQLGDFVGIAATAKVPIEDVSAAYATMTLAGISAAEASTSTARVLQSLIDPSEGLAHLYSQLGYQSGEAALKGKGLRGVMDDIRTATGGNITSLQSLFPEFRAFRGVVALMSNDGKLYATTADKISNSASRVGATQRALDEQSKSGAYQWRLFVNQLMAGAITIGQHLEPAFISFLHAVQKTTAVVGPGLAAGLATVQPLLLALWRVVGDVSAILAQLVVAATPIGAALLGAFGGPLLGALTGVAHGVGSVTGFLASHRDVVLLLAAAYTATLIPSLAQMQVLFSRFILTPIVLGLNQLLIGAGATGAGLRALASSMLTVQGVATAGLAVAIFAAVRGWTAWTNAQNDAKAATDKILQTFDPMSDKAHQQIADLAAVAQHSAAVGRQYAGFVGTMKAGFSEVFGDGRVGKIAADGQAAADSMVQMQTKMANVDANLDALGKKTNLGTDALKGFAKAAGADLTGAFADSGDQRQKILDYMGDLAHKAGVTTATMQAAVGDDTDAWKALADTIKKATDAATSAFTSSTNVLGSFNPDKTAKGVQSATDGVSKAQQHLSEVEARVGAKRKTTISDVQSLTHAHEALAKAQGKLGKAQGADAANTLEGQYRTTLAQARAFTTGIATLTKRGLNPDAVAKLLEAGPEKAAPALQAMMSDHSGRLIKMVNQTETELSRINDQVILQTRIVTLATASTNDKMARDAKTAMAIAAAAYSAGGKGTADALAKSLHMAPGEIQRIAQEFGITLAAAVQGAIDLKPITVKVGASLVSLDPDVSFHDPVVKPKGGKGRAMRATGGGVYGPGTSTSDSVPALLSHGEHVWTAAEVHAVGGHAAVARLRAAALHGHLPAYARGGGVGYARGGGVQVVTVPVSSTHRTDAPIYVGTVVTADAKSFTDWGQGRRDFSSAGVR